MTDSDYTVVAGICRERPIGKRVAPKDGPAGGTFPQPAAAPAPRRRRPVPADFKVRLDAVTTNPGEDIARIKIRIDLATLAGLVALAQKEGYSLEALIRRCLKREIHFARMTGNAQKAARNDRP
jgi:hypothetical protein